jgi:three-Cys-motif partner protein
MPTESFFNESSEQSRVKTAIVSKYFWAWAKVIMPWAKKSGGKIAYIDLFAGPGRYEDGTRSTPLYIVETAIKDPEMSRMLVATFNDADAAKTNSLQAAINALPGLEKLKFKPTVMNKVVGEEMAQLFERTKLAPTLFFVDPWGYQGLSLRLVNSVLKDWGCDCVFFFNYNRINMGLANDLVKQHMDALFGVERADRLRSRLEGMNPADREFAIVEELAQALRDMGGKFVLPFGFTNESGSRTSHHLIFVSKNVLGYTIMKNIMAGESTSAPQGVPSFKYNPADERFPLLFDLTRPLDDLQEMLLREFAGRRLTMNAVFEAHHVGKPFVEKNYKDVLRKLEAAGKITSEPPAVQRPKRSGEVTFGAKVVVEFPPLGR